MTGGELVHHLLTDLLVKGAIGLAALLAFALGALLLWRKLGR
ncbi:hypothetical protein [Amycolatopsis sp.]|nr:hypothetical protein [Amycolatopsis sp.]HVV11116.1 hypothetical protein [Amycolatopsis sp.]